MKCDWESFLKLIPPWLRPPVENQTKDSLQELRLRMEKPPELVTQAGSIWLDRHVVVEDIRYCINAASRYSPWTAGSIADGYITAQGGHRIGICGETVSIDGEMTGIREPASVCIRVARDYPGIARNVKLDVGSILIIGKPGSGKTTLLRDLIRHISNTESGCVAVVDEKRELFPLVQSVPSFQPGKRTDILSGCKKAHGIETVLRNMGPATIAVDEITSAADCNALLHAGWCGVRLLASAHAGGVSDLMTRPVYKPIIDCGLFETIIILQPDKSWRMERLVK